MMSQRKTESLLSRVQEGMTVFDARNERIGTVTDMYFGAAADDTSASGSQVVTESQADVGDRPRDTPIAVVPLVAANNLTAGDGNLRGVLPLFTFEDEIPEQLRPRLLQQGFIKLNGNGIFASARYVTPDQIASVQSDGVHLNTNRDQLIKNP